MENGQTHEPERRKTGTNKEGKISPQEAARRMGVSARQARRMAKRYLREFLTQTAYLIVIRILLVRIMEDKKLVKRMFTNGGVALWFLQVDPL